jgi:hypothetical protein
MSGGYAVASTAKVPRIRSGNKVKRVRYTKEKPMKLTFKQRIRNWLMSDDDEAELSYHSMSVEESRLDSDGMRLQVYKASGGFVVEVRKYDRRDDENRNSMYVINNDKDLGEEMGKIITMECMK